MTLKRRYSIITGVAQKILDEIGDEEKESNKYAWARGNKEGELKIRSCLNKLKTKLDPFEIDFMLMNEKEMPNFKKKHGQSMILVKMKAILNRLTTPIEDLEEVVESINQATETLANPKSNKKSRGGEDDQRKGWFV